MADDFGIAASDGYGIKYKSLSRDEKHAIGHAEYLVERATPDEPEVSFDYTLVQSLLGVIKRLSH